MTSPWKPTPLGNGKSPHYGTSPSTSSSQQSPDPDVEILEALPLLLSMGLDVSDGGIGGEDVSPLVGILLMIEGKRLIPVFQGNVRSVSGQTSVVT